MTERETAILLMKQKEYDEALVLFKKLLEKSPRDGGLLYMAGQCCRFLNNISEAVSYLKQSSECWKEEAPVFLALGIAFQLDEEYESAIQSFNTAIELDPNYVEAYNSLGLTFKKMKAYKKALNCYQDAIESHVNIITESLLKSHTSDIISEEKKTLLIEDSFFSATHKILRSNPMYAILLNNVGGCLLKLGDTLEARKHFLESIEMTPDGYNYPDPHDGLKLTGQ